jgi:hypothetical protein
VALDGGGIDTLWARFMREISVRRESISVSKADLRAAAVALDSWLDDNASSANSALPTAARTGLTTKQKAMLFMVVTYQRYMVS